LAEYRLDDLARISGVSARNIRAYRERGLLDPPRRIGRSAYYDDYHLSQLKTINQLLRRGFNSAHIAEFFASMRQGADLTDILGIQQAVLGPPTDEGVAGSVVPSDMSAVGIDRGLRRGAQADRLRPCRTRRRRRGAGRHCDGCHRRAHCRSGALHACDSGGVRRDPGFDRQTWRPISFTRWRICTRRGSERTMCPSPRRLAELSQIVLDYRDLGNTGGCPPP